MGTVVELLIDGEPSVLAAAERTVVAEIVRLERVFSAFDTSSELHRWRTGATDLASDELVELLTMSLSWQQRARGAYNPAVGALTRAWSAAEATGEAPSEAELVRLARSIREPRFAIADGAAVRLGDCREVNLNAIAKGFIVDRAAAAGMAVAGVDAITVNAGGDLVHRGAGSITVGIEDPRNAYDNTGPLTALTIAREAVATSGSARRGYYVGARRFSHVIDPRTGQPVDRVLSASVVASDAVVADIVATVASVLDPPEGVAFVERLAGVGCYIVDRDGTVWQSSSWTSRTAAGFAQEVVE